MKKLVHIVKGWSKKLGIVSTSTAEKKLSELRLMICGKCMHSDKSKLLVLFENSDEAEYRDVLYCKKCTCPCEPKSLVVDESCPIQRW